MTLEEYLAEWLDVAVKPNRRWKTWSIHESHVRVHIVPALGEIPIDELTPYQVQRFIAQMLAEGLKPGTVGKIRSTLRIALRRAIAWGLVMTNAADAVDLPRVVPKKGMPLSSSEVHTFFEHVAGDWYEALYVVAITMGLRQAELLGLKWSDVDFSTRTLHIRQQLQIIDHEFMLVPLKTQDSVRSLRMPELAAEALARRWEAQSRRRLQVGTKNWHDSDLVFTTRLGRPLHRSTVQREFQRQLKGAGLKNRRFHDLRHTCATLLVEQGVHPRVIQQTLGHSTMAHTMSIYSHVDRKTQALAAGAMEKALD